MRSPSLYLPAFILIALTCMLPSAASAGTTIYGTPAAPVAITKTGPATASPGDVITYTLKAYPTGSGNPCPYWIRDTLPSGLQAVSFSVSASWTPCGYNGSNFACPFIIGDFYTSQKEVLLSAYVPRNTACGTVFTNQATLASDQPFYSTAGPAWSGPACIVPVMHSQVITTTIVCPGSSSSSSSSSSVQSSSSSSAPLLGCIDVLKETYDTQSAILTPVTQFTFQLDGQVTAYNNGNGLARFQNVTPGTHTVTETVPAGWTQLNVTPVNGTVIVSPGSNCAVVTFKNKQVLPPASSSSSSSSVPMTPYVHPHCSDGLDNDGDGRTDFFDPGCYPNNVFNPIAYNPNDNSEVNAVVLCRWVRTNNQWVRTCS